MKKLSMNEILEAMCAPETTDAPQEEDFIPRNAEDNIADEMFIKSWIDRERR